MKVSTAPTVLVVALLGCLGCEEPVFTNPSVLEISARASADSVLPGNPITVTVEVSNPTHRRVEFDYSCAYFDVVILDSADDDVLQGSGCYPTVLREVFQPGEVKRFSFSWAAEVKFYKRPEFVREPVPPGRYRIIARLIRRLVESDPVHVTVLPTRVLSLRLQPDEPAVGETVRITTALENRLAHAVEFEVLSACTFGVFVLRDGERVTDLSGDCTIVDRRLPLAAHQTYEETTTWVPTAPGDHVIEAQLGVPTLEPDLRARAELTISPE